VRRLNVAWFRRRPIPRVVLDGQLAQDIQSTRADLAGLKLHLNQFDQRLAQLGERIERIEPHAGQEEHPDD
jgi:hypothetical protein